MAKPLRILAFFLDAYAQYGKSIGGMERRFLELTSRLTANGAEIFTLEYHPALSEMWNAPKHYHSISIHGRARYRQHALLETLRLIPRSILTCLKHRCNVLYVGDRLLSGRLYILPAYFTSLLCRKPLVIVFHHLRHQDYTEDNPITLAAYRHAKAVIAVSHATANDVKRTFHVQQVVVTGNGINLQKFQPNADQPKIYDAIYFGRISKEKGIATLLRAWKIVTQEQPSARLLLMGGAKAKPKAIFETLAKDLAVEQTVTFAGFLPEQPARNRLATSKIFVLPSTEEGFGLTVLEAMATGLPCILSDLPALRENFHSAAIFVEPRKATQLAHAILTLLSNPKKREDLASKGQALVKHFSWDTVAERELEVLRTVIQD